MEELPHDSPAAEEATPREEDPASSAAPGDEHVAKPAVGEAEADAELLAAIDEIDYSAYESPELRASIEAILSVPLTLLFFLRVVGLSYPLCELLIVWAFRDKGWLTFGAAVIAGLVASLIFAVLLAITLLLRRILTECVKVIDMTLNIVGKIISDIGATGDQGIIQTTALVFGGVSRNLVLPIVESVVRAQLGLLGRPLLWVYRKVFVKAVDAATNRILLAASKIQIPGNERLGPTSEAVGKKITSGAETADWLLASLRPYVVGGSRALTLGILVPAWVVLGLVTIAIVCVFWFGYHFG